MMRVVDRSSDGFTEFRVEYGDEDDPIVYATLTFGDSRLGRSACLDVINAAWPTIMANAGLVNDKTVVKRPRGDSPPVSGPRFKVIQGGKSAKAQQ